MMTSHMDLFAYSIKRVRHFDKYALFGDMVTIRLPFLKEKDLLKSRPV